MEKGEVIAALGRARLSGRDRGSLAEGIVKDVFIDGGHVRVVLFDRIGGARLRRPGGPSGACVGLRSLTRCEKGMSLMADLTDRTAQQRMEAHHGQLVAAVDESVAALERACLVDDTLAAEAAAARFQTLLEGDILPHASGEERSFYAAAEPLNGALVRSLTHEHEVLRGLIDTCHACAADLGRPADRLACLGVAHEIRALFSVHAQKEDRFVTPLLLERTPEGTVARLFVEMHANA